MEVILAPGAEIPKRKHYLHIEMEKYWMLGSVIPSVLWGHDILSTSLPDLDTVYLHFFSIYFFVAFTVLFLFLWPELSDQKYKPSENKQRPRTKKQQQGKPHKWISGTVVSLLWWLSLGPSNGPYHFMHFMAFTSGPVPQALSQARPSLPHFLAPTFLSLTFLHFHFVLIPWSVLPLTIIQSSLLSTSLQWLSAVGKSLQSYSSSLQLKSHKWLRDPFYGCVISTAVLGMTLSSLIVFGSVTQADLDRMKLHKLQMLLALSLVLLGTSEGVVVSTFLHPCTTQRFPSSRMNRVWNRDFALCLLTRPPSLNAHGMAVLQARSISSALGERGADSDLSRLNEEGLLQGLLKQYYHCSKWHSHLNLT